MAEEKAKELVEKYIPLVYCYIGSGMLSNDYDENVAKDNAKFKIGDKLKASEYDKEEYGLEFVTITSINKKNQVYHWEATDSLLGGTIHSGYFFKEAELYETL